MIYRAEIKSIIDPKKTVILSSQGDAQLLIRDLSITYNYLSYESPGRLFAVGFRDRGTPLDAIKTGDIIFLYENNIRIYVGYILSLETETSATRLTQQIRFDTILSQWTRQKMISTAKDVIVTIKPDDKQSTINTNFVVGRLRVQQLLNFLIKESIFEYAKNHYQFDSPQSKFGIIYENKAIFNSTTDVYYYPAVGITKAQALNTVLFPFQQILYQDPSGSIRFSSPSYSNKTNLKIDSLSSNYLQIRLTEREVTVTNYVVSTLLFLGIFPTAADKNQNLTSISTPNSKYFDHLTKLLNSGFFTQTYVDVRNLGTDITQDPILLNVLSNILENPALQSLVKSPTNSNKTKSIAPLFSNRVLAEALTYSKNISLELIRDASYTDIPIGKIFQVDNVSWIAISATLTLASAGAAVRNTMSIVGAPLSSCTGAWIA